jgi:uncharacterized protein (DUF488 family)
LRRGAEPGLIVPSQTASAAAIPLVTLGYGGRTPPELITLCRSADVVTVVDVRLRPDRASMGIYVKAKDPTKGIESLFSRAAIGYVSLPELGNIFMEFEDWAPRYTRLLERAGDLLVERLHMVQGPVALLCAEKDARACHRQPLAQFLVARGTHRFLGHLGQDLVGG